MHGDDTYRFDDDVTMRIAPRDDSEGPTRPVTSAPRQRETMAVPGPPAGPPGTVAFTGPTGPQGTVAFAGPPTGPTGTVALPPGGGIGPHGTIATGPRGTLAMSGPHGTLVTGAPLSSTTRSPHATTRTPTTGGISLRIGKGVVPPAPTRADRSGNRTTTGRVVRAISAVLTVVLIAGVAWTGWQWWQWWHNRARVTSVSVSAAPQPGCDVEFDIVGTVYTNGKPGKIVYQWERSDGRRTPTITQTVRTGQTSTDVHLHWKFSGQGAATVTAKLYVLAPNETDASTTFNYTCP